MRDMKENLGLKGKTEILRMVWSILYRNNQNVLCQLKEKYCEKKF